MDSESPLDLSTGHYLFPPINKKGRPFILIAFLIAAAILTLTFLFAKIAFWILLIPLCLTVYWVGMFFRDPERFPPSDATAIVSPADGTVSLIKEMLPPKELGLENPQKVWRISVFMSVLDVHVNRMPTAATVVKKAYVPGKFLNADLDKASEDNERLIYQMKLDDGREMVVVQIAGLIARRIVSFVDEGTHLDRAVRFGLIRFGSRLDIYLPAGVKPNVSLGQTMVAGESILANL